MPYTLAQTYALHTSSDMRPTHKLTSSLASPTHTYAGKRAQKYTKTPAKKCATTPTQNYAPTLTQKKATKPAQKHNATASQIYQNLRIWTSSS